MRHDIPDLCFFTENDVRFLLQQRSLSRKAPGVRRCFYLNAFDQWAASTKPQRAQISFRVKSDVLTSSLVKYMQ
jgi:hypothetical protein